MKKTGTIKALLIISEGHVRTGRDFARLMWPDSPCWQVRYNIGHGATQGVGMWLTGGSFLGKLRQKGLITKSVFDGRIVITKLGLDLIYSARNQVT